MPAESRTYASMLTLLTEGFQVRVLAEEPIPSISQREQSPEPPGIVPNFVPHLPQNRPH
jgi:hypothetical protein